MNKLLIIKTNNEWELLPVAGWESCYTRDFDYFYLTIYKISKRAKWRTHIVERCGTLSNESFGRKTFSLEKAKEEAEKLAINACRKILKDLNYKGAL